MYLLEVNPPAVNAASNFAISNVSYNITAGLSSLATVDERIGRVVVLAGPGIELTNGRISGKGPVVQIVFFKESNLSNITGSYQINDTSANQTARLVYSIDYDSSQANPEEDDELLSGILNVEQDATGQFVIELDNGLTMTGMQDFELFFDGGLLLLN